MRTLLVALALAAAVAPAATQKAEDFEKFLGITAEHAKGRLRATWPFTSRSQLRAFKSSRENLAFPAGGGVALGHEDVLQLRELRLAVPCSVHLEVYRHDAAASLRAYLVRPGANESGAVGFLNMPVPTGENETENCDGVCEVESELTVTAANPTRVAHRKWCRMTIRMTASGAMVSVDGRKVDGDPARLPAAVGLSLLATDGEVRIRNLRIDGRVVRESLRKLLGGAAAQASTASPKPKERANAAALLANEEHVELANQMLKRLREGKIYRHDKTDVQFKYEKVNDAVEAWNKRRYEDAVSLLRAARDETPGEVAISYLIGKVLTEAGKIDKAIAAYRAVVKRDPKFFQGWRALGLLYLRQGERDEAEKCLKRARRLAGRDPWNIVFEALLQMQKGKFQSARTKIRMVRRARPDSKAIKLLEDHLKLLVNGPWGADRHRKKTASYVIESNAGGEVVDRLTAVLDRYRAFLHEAFPLPKRRKQRSRVWVFDAEQEYEAFSATLAHEAEHSLGAYHPGINTLLLFASLSADQNREVVFHEAFHQYLDTAVRSAPLWFNEGLAEYYGATTFGPDKKAVEGALLAGRVAELRHHLGQKGDPVPFETLMLLKPRRFMDPERAGFHYAQSWSMVHFFKHGGHAKATELFATYTRAIIAGKNPAKAFNLSFGNAKPPSLDTIETAWRRYVDQHLFKKAKS